MDRRPNFLRIVLPRPSASGCEWGCWAPSRMPGTAHRRMGRKGGWPCSSTRARRSRGWRPLGWKRPWSGAAFPSAGAGWRGPS
eukprot:7602813-Alexandrium_andersonii.AAC.1